MHKVKRKPIKNEQGDDKFEVIDSNVKDTEDIEDNVIVDSVVYMAWTDPVLKGKEQFIIDTGCIGSHIFKDTELLTRRHKSSVPVRDFSGKAHSTNMGGYLFHTNQHVLVMPESKVNQLNQSITSDICYDVIVNQLFASAITPP
jgi:hypothetical protein